MARLGYRSCATSSFSPSFCQRENRITENTGSYLIETDNHTNGDDISKSKHMQTDKNIALLLLIFAHIPVGKKRSLYQASI